MSDAEYSNLPLDFKKVIASTHGSNKINITSEDERISLFIENRNITIPINTTLFEANSGFFNIRGDKRRRQGNKISQNSTRKCFILITSNDTKRSSATQRR